MRGERNVVQQTDDGVTNPESELTLHSVDVLAVFGSRKQITRFHNQCGGV